MRPAYRLPLAAMLLLAACENPSGSDVGSKPARMDVVSGDLQPNAVVGTEIGPIVVRVVNADGKPLKGQLVNFVVAGGGGSVFAGSAQTNENGEARERWTLGTVAGDTQRVEARAVDQKTGQAQVFATFRAVGAPDAPSALKPVSPQRTGAMGTALADSLAARVEDRYGNAVPNATVSWSVKRGGGSVSPAQSKADAAGVARTQWVLGTRADSTQLAAASLSASVQAEFAATATLGGGVAFTVSAVSGGGQRVRVMTGAAEPLKIAVRTADGRPIAGAPVRWTGAGLESAVVDTVTNGNGEATARVTIGREARNYLVNAQVPGVAGASAEFALVGTPDAPASLAPWYTGTLGGAVSSLLDDSIGAVVRDQYGNAVPGATVSWSSVAGTGSFSRAAGTTDAAGIAWTHWTLGPTAGIQRARAVVQGTNTAIEIPAHAGTDLRVVAGDLILSLDGALWEQPAVALWGPEGPIGDARVEWTVRSGGGSVSLDASRTSLTRPGGSATTTWTLGGTAGAHQLRARVGNLAVTFTARRPAGASLQLLGAPGGRVLDTDGIRALVLDSAGGTYTLRIRRLAGGADSVVASGDSPRPVNGLLFEGGALYTMQPGTGPTTIHEWRAGASARVGSIASAPSGAERNGIRKEHVWAAWGAEGKVFRRNLSTAVTDSLIDPALVRVYGPTDYGYVLFDSRTGAGNLLYWWNGTEGRFVAPDVPGKTADGEYAYSLRLTDSTVPGEYSIYSYLVTAPVPSYMWQLAPGQQADFAARNRKLAIREMGTLGTGFIRYGGPLDWIRLGRRPKPDGVAYGYESNVISPAGSAAFIFTEAGISRVLVAPVSGREPFVAEVPAGSRLIERGGKILLLSAGSVYLLD